MIWFFIALLANASVCLFHAEHSLTTLITDGVKRPLQIYVPFAVRLLMLFSHGVFSIRQCGFVVRRRALRLAMTLRVALSLTAMSRSPCDLIEQMQRRVSSSQWRFVRAFFLREFGPCLTTPPNVSYVRRTINTHPTFSTRASNLILSLRQRRK